MDKKDEFNLDEFKDLLNDVPDAGDFDLESIIAEVEGRALPNPRPSRCTASRYTASLPLPPQSRCASSLR
ncbi:MAG: hypothetical protein ACLR4Z_09945 [Butyricicoccaceae bacterium]